MTTHFFSFHARLLATAFALGASSALAQPADSPDNTLYETGEIIVTAEKRADTASRIGMSLSVLDAASLEKLNINDADDLVKQVPGFTVSKSASGIPIYNLRGVGFNTPNLSSSSPVGFYVDQIAYAFPYMASGPIYDIERVEVLKGPQGTLYGRNTTGGLVNFITAKPKDELQGAFQVEAANYARYGVEGFVTGPITSTLKGRLAFKSDLGNKGWQHSVTRDDELGEVNRKAFRASLQWDPDPAFTANAMFNYWKDQSDTQAPQATYFLPENAPFGRTPEEIAPSLITNGKNRDADWTPYSYQPSPNTSAPRRPYRKDSRFYSATLELTYRLSSDISLTSLTGYNDLRRADAQNLDGVQYELVSNDMDGRIKSFSQELRFSGESDKMNWIIGGYYSRDKLNESQLVYLGDFSTINLLRFVGSTLNDPRYTALEVAEGFRVNKQLAIIKNRSVSAFGNFQYQITDALKLTTGVRYTEDKSRHGGCAADAQGNTVPVWNTAVALLAGLYPTYDIPPGECFTFLSDFSGPAGLVRGTLKENNLSWKGAINWSPVRDLLFYGSVSRGYKSGAFPVIPANAARQFEPATQEKVTAYEIGTKARFGPARFTVAGFYNDYRDKQVFGAIADMIFGRLDRLVNIPKSKTYGIEASLDLDLGSGLSMRGAGSYLRTRVDEYVGFDPFGDEIDFAGMEFPNSPRWQLSGNVGYSTTITQRLMLDLLVDATYQSRSHGDFRDLSSYTVFPPFGGTDRPVIDEPLFNIPAYALVNCSITLSDQEDGWRLTLWMRNILDKDYATSSNFTRDVATRFSGIPRTYGATLRFNF